MLVPSIDLMNGNAVQLVGGKEMELDAGDPRPLAERFGRVGEIAVVDLDAAMGQGSNENVIKELIQIAPCRVGGGIRSVEDAIKWLDAGATKVVLGTAATPEILRELPRERVIAALDAVDGEVVVKGWKEKTGRRVEDQLLELEEYVSGFLLTFVEREGRMKGIDLNRVEELTKKVRQARLTIAGGVTTAKDVADLDRLEADAQVGMALYKEQLGLSEAFAAPMVSDRPDGLWPTVVCDERGVALGLAYSDASSLKMAIDRGQGVYHSRKRGTWIKGKSSGATQDLLRVEMDCDRDTLRFFVRQHGVGFCHLERWNCFGLEKGLGELERRLKERIQNAPEGSYTKRLLDDPALLKAKLVEEAAELATATTPDEVSHETADLIYFAMVAMIRGGSSLNEVENILDRRSLKVTRRPGNAKVPLQG